MKTYLNPRHHSGPGNLPSRASVGIWEVPVTIGGM
jgi:hypothetical protein